VITHYSDQSVVIKPGETIAYYDKNAFLFDEELNVYGATNTVANNESAVNGVDHPSEVKSVPAVAGKAYTYSVDSYTKQVGLSVKKGQKINLSASGQIVLGVFAGSGGPEGIEGFKSYCIEPDFRHGALLIRVGEGKWTAVGSHSSIMADMTGTINFMVNDADPSNNSGDFKVLIKVGL
jgi:hypothetical protein